MAEFGRVIVTRHPETLNNAEHTYSGRRDVALTECGRSQATQAAEAISAWKPERIVTSPLQRCRAIADKAAQNLGLEPMVDERLIEIDFGAIEGVKVSEVKSHGFEFPWPIVDGRSVPAPGGESFEDLIARARSFVDWVSTQPGKTACVTHGGLSRAIFAAVYDESVERFWNRVIVNVSTQVFVSDGTSLALQSAGLSPDELTLRAESGYVPGGDIASSTAELDDDLLRTSAKSRRR